MSARLGTFGMHVSGGAAQIMRLVSLHGVIVLGP